MTVVRSRANEAVVLGMWRGRLRVRQGGVLSDSRMHWVHRVRDGKVHWTASSPDLARLLADAGLPGRANEAYIAMHRAEDED